MNRKEAGKLGSIAAQATIAEKYKKRLELYNVTPSLCIRCSDPLDYAKRKNIYCSHRCAASTSNTKRGASRYCFYCGNLFGRRSRNSLKYCSRACEVKSRWEEKLNSFLLTAVFPSRPFIRQYLILLQTGRCVICSLYEWNSKEIPLVVDHINGNSEDNTPENLRMICCNCDAQTDTYKSKNIGNGRYYRRERYKQGKSY